MKIIDKINASSKPFYSLEFFPPKSKDSWPAFFETVKKLKKLDPLFASVTYGAGGNTQDNTLEIASRLLSETGISPMPHLTCVGADEEKIRDFLTKLSSVGVNNILALRGDAPKNDPETGEPLAKPYDWSKGRFRYASNLVTFIKKEFPEFGISVAGYPAPHPESESFIADRKHTAIKLSAGADFIITQLFFDVRGYMDLVEQLRDMGITKPVIPGILPIVSLDSIRHVLTLCGGYIPAKLFMVLEEANTRGGVEAVREAGVDYTVEQIRQLLDAGAPGIHLYTLNRADLCLKIAEAVGKI